jgi:cell division protein FtsB
MSKSSPFVTQLVIVGGFLVFLYVFFALATSVYKDYKLDSSIQQFETEIDQLAEKAKQKPKGVAFYQSPEYKDRYAKENLNLLNPGERLIVIPHEDQNVKAEQVATDAIDNTAILKLPNRNQWWAYFFGHTLVLNAVAPTAPDQGDQPPAEKQGDGQSEPAGGKNG